MWLLYFASAQAAQAGWESHNNNCRDNPLTQGCCYHYDVDPELSMGLNVSYPFNNRWSWYLTDETPTNSSTITADSPEGAVKACYEMSLRKVTRIYFNNRWREDIRVESLYRLLHTAECVKLRPANLTAVEGGAAAKTAAQAASSAVEVE